MKNISELRTALYETIQLLKEGKIDASQAKAVSELGQVIVNSAKVEVEFIREAGGKGTGFIEVNEVQPKLDRPKGEYSNTTPMKIANK